MARRLGLCLALVLAAGVARGAVDPKLLAGMKARSIGPAGMSGRVAAIEAVESAPDIVYAGAATGGVWKSTNGGLTWKPIFDEEKVAAVGAIAVFQPNPAIVWVGTGEGNVRNSASVGYGIYRSTDGGKKWTHLGLEKTERIYRILLHPADPEVAYACALGREWGENPERGVFRTSDGGKSWEKVLYVDERTGCGDLVMDPSNPEKLIASMWQFRRWPYFFRSGGPGSGVHLTHDGGQTWKKLQEEDGLPRGDLGRVGLAVCRSHPDVVYALVEAETSALLRSDDGGKSFKTVNTDLNVAPRPFYFGDLRVHPTQPNRVYSVDYVIRISDDGGKSFRPLIDWDLIHGDYHAMWMDPNNPDLIYLGNDGGVAVSRDGGKTAQFVANLPLAQFYHIAVDNAVPYNVMGGMQDNSSWRGPSAVWDWGALRNHHWQLVGGGDGYDTQPDPEDPNLGYSMWQGGNLMRWNLEIGEWRDVKPPVPEWVELRFNWNSALALDPFEPGTLYYGSQFVHKSTDRGETWTIISPDLTTDNPEWQRQKESGGLTPDVTAAENHTTLLSIAPSPLERGVLWTGSDDGRIHVTRDGGASWTSVEKSLPGVPAGTWVPHIDASPHRGGTAIAVFDDHRRSNWTPYVYRTDDYGKTWKSLATPSLWGYALVVEQDPVAENLLFLGTEFGLWVSLDGGASWMQWKHGVPTVSVMDLVIHPREHDLVLGTHGRAAYVLDDIRPLRTLARATDEKLHLFEVADAQQHWVGPEASGFGLGSGEFRGENRPYGAILTYWLSFPGLPLPDEDEEKERKEKERIVERAKLEWGPTAPPKIEEEEEGEKKKDEKPKVKIQVEDASGKLVRTFEAPAKQGLNRAVWGLQRDAFKLPPPRWWEGEREEHPAGPELPPGTYTVTVSYGGEEASTSVRVLPDPRSSNGDADWQERWNAILQAGALHETTVEAIERIRDTRRDVEALLERAQKGKKEEAEGSGSGAAAEPAAGHGAGHGHGGSASAAGEMAGGSGASGADEMAAGTGASETREMASGAGASGTGGMAVGAGAAGAEEKDPFVEAGKALKKALDDLEKRAWQSPDLTKGIVADDDVLSRIAYVRGYLNSSWQKPSPTHWEYFRQARAALEAFLADFNRFFETEVAAFRSQAEEKGLRLLPPFEPMRINEPGD